MAKKRQTGQRKRATKPKSRVRTAAKGQRVRVNLGSGDTPIDGWNNIDRKGGEEAYPLDYIYDDDSVDEIRASHILEHFPQAEVFEVLKHWVAKLKTDGVIKIAVPDMRKICEGYIEGKDFNVGGVLMGGQVDDNDYHKSIFDQASLAKLMAAAGLIDIQPWVSEHKDCAVLPISLNLMGTKGEKLTITPSKIKALISMPRLGFTDNNHTAVRSLMPFQIELKKGNGVFWDQVLSRLIQKELDAGVETIITMDYDTWFTERHIMAMLRLMQKYPDADAFCPPQIKRETDELLVGTIQDGRAIAGRGDTEMTDEITRICTGHFGMTFFRASAFAKLKKPWFQGVPAKDGGWGDGRQDPDIYFWNNWNHCGLKLFSANRVPIAHLQMMASFPGTPENKFKPIHVYMNDLEMGRIPAHCIPSG